MLLHLDMEVDMGLLHEARVARPRKGTSGMHFLPSSASGVVSLYGLQQYSFRESIHAETHNLSR